MQPGIGKPSKDIFDGLKDCSPDGETYGDIVRRFKERQPLQLEELVLLADTIAAMPEEIYEHYRALQDLCKAELQRIRKAGARWDGHQQEQLAYVIDKAGKEGFILPEKYEEMKKGWGVNACKTKV